MEMPRATWMGDKLLSAVKDGDVSETTVDQSVARLLAPMFEFGVFDNVSRWSDLSLRSRDVTSKAHSSLARELSASSTVMVKNEGVLPIDTHAHPTTIAVIGAQAQTPSVHGGGSGSVTPMYVVSPLQAIMEHMGKNLVTYNDGSDPDAAAKVAAKVDYVVVVVGESSSEGADRPTLALSGNQNMLVSTVAKAAPNKTIVACLHPGGILLPWNDAVSAVLLMFMPGQEAGTRMVFVV